MSHSFADLDYLSLPKASCATNFISIFADAPSICAICARYSIFPSPPVIGENVIPFTENPLSQVYFKNVLSTLICVLISRTIPFLPTLLLSVSNCFTAFCQHRVQGRQNMSQRNKGNINTGKVNPLAKYRCVYISEIYML